MENLHLAEVLFKGCLLHTRSSSF